MNFDDQADLLLNKVIDLIDENDWDIETVLQGHVLTLEFDDGRQIVINKHEINKEIWIASKLGGNHFKLNPEEIWTDSKSGIEFFEFLNKVISQYL